MMRELFSVLAAGPTQSGDEHDERSHRGITIGPEDIGAASTTAADVPSSLQETQFSRLAALLSDPSEYDETEAADVATAYAQDGAGTATFAGTYEDALEELVTVTFDLVADDQIEKAETVLREGLETALGDMQAGLGRYDELADRDTDEYADTILTIEAILESIPFPIYVLDADARVIGWNYGFTALVGMSREEAMGKTARESIIKATYSEGARKKTQAEKVIEDPHRAHQKYDIERYETPYCDGIVYYDTSTGTNMDGEAVEIEFWAVPIFDENDDLVAVMEIHNDRTEEVQRKEGLESMVGEVTRTLQQIGAGDLQARANFRDENDVLETELLDIVEEVNRTADQFQSLVGGVDERTELLAESIQDAADRARQVDDDLAEQNASLDRAAQEMEDFSAAMEEIASTSAEVASAAEQARQEVDAGLESAEDARSVAEEVSDASDDLVETVSQLSQRMDQIEEVAAVINDIADQTNMLALNANIEAARAGEAGSGFAVVADEVKELADETQAYTEEITNHIERIKTQSEETAEAVDESHDKVEEVDAEIRETVAAFEEIADAVDSATDGIEEVADANDDQASRVEQVLADVEQAKDHASRVTESANEIVEETETQREAVGELQEQVSTLSQNDQKR